MRRSGRYRRIRNRSQAWAQALNESSAGLRPVLRPLAGSGRDPRPFVLEREAYLRSTWQASHRPAQIEFEPGLKWLGLEVRDYRLTSADTAEVEFVARQKPVSGPATRLSERSRFVLEDGRWRYLDGV